MADTGSALYLAIDQGGHASRALVFDVRGNCVASAATALDTHYYDDGRVEQEPDALLASVRAAIRAVLVKLGAETRAIAAAGLCTQRASCIGWDRVTGVALTPVLSWQDLRARELIAGLAPHTLEIEARTGLRLTAHYGAGKFRWCLDRVPTVRAAQDRGTLCLGPLASYLLLHLCRERPLCADPANAARTLLWNLATRNWDDSLLTLFGIAREALPPCVPSRHAFGTLVLDDLDIPLVVCTGDQPAALFAAGWPAPEDVYINLGTGAFMQRVLADTAGRAPGLLHSLAYTDNVHAPVVVEGTVNGAGSALAWLAARHDVSVAHIENHAVRWLAEVSTPPLFLNTVSGLGSPYWRADLEARLMDDGGLAEQTVAVIESIVFLLADNIARLPPPAPRRVRISGGLATLDGLCQRLADLTGIEVSRAPEHEASARGLAFLVAGVPAGWEAPIPVARFQPRHDAALQARAQRFHHALEAALGGG